MNKVLLIVLVMSGLIAADEDNKARAAPPSPLSDVEESSNEYSAPLPVPTLEDAPSIPAYTLYKRNSYLSDIMEYVRHSNMTLLTQKKHEIFSHAFAYNKRKAFSDDEFECLKGKINFFILELINQACMKVWLERHPAKSDHEDMAMDERVRFLEWAKSY